MNASMKCQWTVIVRAQNRSHRCYNRAIAEVKGGSYCRLHAKATVRSFTEPGPHRDALIADLPFGRVPYVPDPEGLTRSQRRILDLLQEAAPAVISHEEIVRRAFDREPIEEDKHLVRAHVCGLRARFGHDRIVNARGRGYWMVAS